MTTDRQKESWAEIRRLPRKVPRSMSSGRCVACDVEADELGDGLCPTCYLASVDGQESKVKP